MQDADLSIHTTSSSRLKRRKEFKEHMAEKNREKKSKKSNLTKEGLRYKILDRVIKEVDMMEKSKNS